MIELRLPRLSRRMKTIIALVLSLVLVVGTVVNTNMSAKASDESAKFPYDYTIENILSSYSYFTSGDIDNTAAPAHTVGAIVAGGTAKLGCWGDGAIAASYFGVLEVAGNYAVQYNNETNSYYVSDRSYLTQEIIDRYGFESNDVNVYYGQSKVNEPRYRQNSSYVDFKEAMDHIKAQSAAFAANSDELDKSDIGVKKDGWNDIPTTVDVAKYPSHNIVIDYSDLVKAGSINLVDSTRGNKFGINELATEGYTISVVNVNDKNVGLEFGWNYMHSADVATPVVVMINGNRICNDYSFKKLDGAFQGGQINLDGMNLLWNFPDATGKIATNYQAGHLVAPNASIICGGGNLEGGAIAANIIAEGEDHFMPYNTPAERNKYPTSTPEVTPDETPEVTPDETPEVTPEETPVVTPDETQEVTPEETPVVTPDETPEVTPEETPVVTPDETPEVTPEETPVVTPEETPSVTPDETPDITPEETPDVTPEETPDVTPEITPNITPKETPSVTPPEEIVPVVTPIVTPETTPEVTPEDTPSVTPETTPEDTPSVTPDETPEVTPEETPETTPEVTPVKRPVKFTKSDSKTNVKLEGATFALYYDEDCKAPVFGDDKLPLTATSDDKELGTVNFGELDEGVYYFKEIAAPEGYELSTEIFNISVEYSKVDGEGTILFGRGDDIASEGEILTVPNDPITADTVRLVKEFQNKDLEKLSESERDEILSNTVFTLYRDADLQYPVIVNEDGSSDVNPVWDNEQKKAVVSVNGELIQCGTVYYLVETSAPAGFKKTENVYLCKVDVNGNVTYKVKDSDSDYTEEFPLCQNEEDVPEVTPDITPDTDEPEVTPETTETPEVTPSETPEATPTEEPKVTPDTDSDVPEITPEVPSVTPVPPAETTTTSVVPRTPEVRGAYDESNAPVPKTGDNTNVAILLLLLAAALGTASYVTYKKSKNK